MTTYSKDEDGCLIATDMVEDVKIYSKESLVNEKAMLETRLASVTKLLEEADKLNL